MSAAQSGAARVSATRPTRGPRKVVATTNGLGVAKKRGKATTAGKKDVLPETAPKTRRQVQAADACAERRNDELMALQAILPESDLRFNIDGMGQQTSCSTSVTLSVAACLPVPVSVKVVQWVHRDCAKSVQHVADVLGQVQLDEADAIHSRIHQGTGTDLHRLEFISRDVLHLPPIKILLRLPPGYPEREAPSIVHIDAPYLGALDCGNAHQGSSKAARVHAIKHAAILRASAVQKIRQNLLRQYDELQGEVLFSWYDTLRESLWTEESADHPFAGGNGAIQFEEVVTDNASSESSGSSLLSRTIRAHDLKMRRLAFEGERFGCGICLEELRGTKCWRIDSCQHVFCQECLSGYLSSMIREGYHRQASACPDPECVNARAKDETSSFGQDIRSDGSETGAVKEMSVVGAISDEEMVQFVGKELKQRLDDLQDRAAASTDPRCGYCPRPGCGRLVRGDPKDVGTSYEAMRQCLCGYTYCQFCEKAWHGRSPCDIGSSRALVEAYKAACDNIDGFEKRRAMEFKYGKANLARMVKAYDEEKENTAWLNANSQLCPSCDVRIERSHGCAHMTCKRCNTHFCYRCGTRLDPASPYRHFNTPGQPCYMRLFEIDNEREIAMREHDDDAAIVAAIAEDL